MTNEPHDLISATPLRRVWPGVWPGVCARVGPCVQWLRCALRHESGTATVEFCMVFPIIMFLVLILVQVTLLMVGIQFVNYAAFAATRSAIVYIPDDYSADGEKPNVINPVQGSPKYDAIRASAYLALVPVSGRLKDSSEPLRADAFVAALHDHFASYGQDSPKWIDTLAADRLRYAAANTTVQVMQTVVDDQDVDYFPITPDEEYEFGPREAITVRVTHRLNLSVPYVRGIFDDGELPDGRGKYTEVSAQYTLTNEGVNPDLPDPPEVPRRGP